MSVQSKTPSSDDSTVASFEGALDSPADLEDVPMITSLKSSSNPHHVAGFYAQTDMPKTPEQPSNLSSTRVLLLRDHTPPANDADKQPFFCGITSLKHSLILFAQVCAFFTIIGFSIGVGILIGKSMGNKDLDCAMASSSSITAIESAKDVTTAAPTSTSAAPTAAVLVPDPLLYLDQDCGEGWSYQYPTQHDPSIAIDLGSYGGSMYCRSDSITCQPMHWTAFNSHSGTHTQWFRATATENSVCQANVEHRIHLTVPQETNFDLHIYKSTSSDDGSARVLYNSSTNAPGTDEEVILSYDDGLLENDAFEYYIMVEYRSGSSCAEWVLDVYGHDCD